VVAKRRVSKYTGALNDDWHKVKCMRVHDFVIGGWISGTDHSIAALLLGEVVDGDLRYVGQVRSPFDSRLMSAVRRLLTPRTISPFRDEMNDLEAKFCEPAFRASVEFLDFTDDGYLRHPAFRRFANELTSEL
jgi:bifunctional non-homologous end joining protein LigD